MIKILYSHHQPLLYYKRKSFYLKRKRIHVKERKEKAVSKSFICIYICNNQPQYMYNHCQFLEHFEQKNQTLLSPNNKNNYTYTTLIN